MKAYKNPITRPMALTALLLTLSLNLTACGGNSNSAASAGETGSPVEAKDAGTKEAGMQADQKASAVKEDTADTSKLDSEFNIYMEARFPEQNSTVGYLPLDNGDCVKIQADGEISNATISPNRKYLLVRKNNGELYVTDIQQKSKKVITQNCASSRVYPSNEAVSFQVNVKDEEHLMRYTFADGKLTDLGATTAGRISSQRTAIVGMCGGDMCLLLPGSEEPLRYPGVGNDEIRFQGLSDDGSTVIWTEETDQFLMHNLYTLGADGQAQLVGPLKIRGLVYTDFSKDNQLCLVASQEVEHMYLKDASGQWRYIELPGDLKNETSVFETDAGPLDQANAADIHYFYMRCGNQLCAVSTDGTVTVMRTSVRDFDIVDGMLYYSDVQKNIYAASLNGTEVSDDVQLLSGMDTFAVSPGGQYLYGMYVHSDDEKVRSLSVYPLHEENPEETVLSETVYADAHVYLSADEECAFYIQDIEKAGESSNYMGTLMMYRADTKETTVIDQDVYKNTMVNGREQTVLSEYGHSLAGVGSFLSLHGSLMYKKKPEADTTGYRNHWYYYNGSECVLMAEDLYF